MFKTHMMVLLQSSTETIQKSIEIYYNGFLHILPRVALALLVIILGVLISQLITKFYRKKFLKRSDDPLMTKFLMQAVTIVLVIFTIMLALRIAGLDGIATGLLTAVGGSAIILGFAFQDIGKNFLAGIILAFNRPFNINDTIKIDDIFGKVKELSFRYSHIKTFDGRDIYIPNSDVLTKPVENYTADGFYRLDFVVGIGYEDDIESAKNVIQNVLDENLEIVKDEEHENYVIEDELATSTVNLRVFFWVYTVDYRKASMILRGVIIRKVKEALAAKDFNLPSDIVELKLYKNAGEIPFKINKENPNDLPLN